MLFDWTISVGNIVQIAAFLGTALWILMSMRADLSILRSDLIHVEKSQNDLNQSFLQLSNILTQVAVQDNRLHMVEKAIDELRHGQGFISTK